MSEPELSGNEWRYLKECLDSGWVSSAGPFVERFERSVAESVGVPHAVAVSSGTAALHTALRIVGVEPNDEVLVSDLTFIAPVNAIRYCQAHPVLVDADAASWQIDCTKLERFLADEAEIRSGQYYNRRTGRRIRAILPVHILGLACDMERIAGIAARYGLKLVEDAAEALGVRIAGRHAGTFGDAGVLSFNGNKIVTAGGGGMIVTGDAELARYARYLTTQAKDDAVESIHHEIGYNYRLTSLQAAVGLAQLERLEEFLERKRAIARGYEEGLRDLGGITLMPSLPQVRGSYWLYTILLPKGVTRAERQAVVGQLQADGIQTRPLWHPIHELRPYRDCQAVEIEQAVDLQARAISLPSSTGMTREELRRCIDAVRSCWRW